MYCWHENAGFNDMHICVDYRFCASVKDIWAKGIFLLLVSMWESIERISVSGPICTSLEC